MGLIRLLVIAAIIWLGFILFKRWLAGSARPRQREEAGSEERMVKCAYCGVHVPESQAIRKGSHYYCCPEHRDGHGQ